MKIFKCSQNKNSGYDTYDSFVCFAEDDKAARHMLPGKNFSTWTSGLNYITVEYLGVAREGATAGVICASFNAG